jgi:hypothetical protein
MPQLSYYFYGHNSIQINYADSIRIQKKLRDFSP